MILDESLFESTTNDKVVVHLLPDDAQASYGTDYWKWMLDDDGLYGEDGRNGIVIMDNRGKFIIHNYTPYSNEEILGGDGSIEETLTSLSDKTYKEFISTGYSQGDYFVCYYPDGEFSRELLLTLADVALGMYEIYEVQGNENGDYDTQIGNTVIICDSLDTDVKHQIADIIGVDPQDIIIKKPVQRWDYEELDENVSKKQRYFAKEVDGKGYVFDRKFSTKVPSNVDKDIKTAKASAKKWNKEDSLQESIDWYGGIQEITRKDYQHFLNCLPPAEPLEQVQGYTGQFLVGEPFMTDDNGHELFSQFGKKGGKYYFLGNHRAKKGSYIGDSEADQDAYYSSMKESVEQPPLWDGKYRPEDITPEYVRKLDMPTSLKLLRWFDKWAEKGVKESVEGDQIAQDFIDSKNANYEADKETTREVRKELARQGIATDENGTPLTESAEDCAKAMREQDPLVMNLAMGFAKGNGHILDQVLKGEKTLEQVIEEVSAQSNFLTKEMWDTVIRCAMFCDRGKSSKEQTDSLEEDTSAKAYAKKLGQDDIQYFTKKNQFNYNVKQVRIDNTNKTYEFGTFKITSGRESTKNGREFDRLIDKLKELGYTEVKKSVKESAPRQCDKSMCEDINQDTFTDNGLAAIINDLIQDEWQAIQGYNDAIVNFETEGRADLVQILHDILNEENLHVGQLETLLEQVSGSANSIDKGKAEAETQLTSTPLGESYGDERYFPYNPELGWTEEDIALHKSIDWKERNYRDYEVAEDSFKGKVYAYGKDIDEQKEYTFHKFIRSNPIYPPYYKAVDFKDGGLVGPMYDGRKHKTYGVHDRYETQEIYDMLSN